MKLTPFEELRRLKEKTAKRRSIFRIPGIDKSEKITTKDYLAELTKRMNKNL